MGTINVSSRKVGYWIICNGIRENYHDHHDHHDHDDPDDPDDGKAGPQQGGQCGHHKRQFASKSLLWPAHSFAHLVIILIMFMIIIISGSCSIIVIIISMVIMIMMMEKQFGDHKCQSASKSLLWPAHSFAHLVMKMINDTCNTLPAK